MNNLKILSLVIKDELGKLRLLDKEKDALLKEKPSNYILRAGGSILHDFYTGIEKIFENIAKEIDHRLPTGEEWHSELLHQMALDITGLNLPSFLPRPRGSLGSSLAFVTSFANGTGLNSTGRK